MPERRRHHVCTPSLCAPRQIRLNNDFFEKTRAGRTAAARLEPVGAPAATLAFDPIFKERATPEDYRAYYRGERGPRVAVHEFYTWAAVDRDTGRVSTGPNITPPYTSTIRRETLERPYCDAMLKFLE